MPEGEEAVMMKVLAVQIVAACFPLATGPEVAVAFNAVLAG
jgi:hypothetical protein